jgi:hypothetical protein
VSYLVVKRHDAEPGEALVVGDGERLSWERRPTEWDGWLYCESRAGVRGWVPEQWLRLEGDQAVMVRDYDASELTVSEGDVVEGELVESGWLLARDAGGRRGWVPLVCLGSRT